MGDVVRPTVTIGWGRDTPDRPAGIAMGKHAVSYSQWVNLFALDKFLN